MKTFALGFAVGFCTYMAIGVYSVARCKWDPEFNKELYNVIDDMTGNHSIQLPRIEI